MPQSPSQRSRRSEQPLAVDFIDNRLGQHVPGYDDLTRALPTSFNPMEGRYEPLVHHSAPGVGGAGQPGMLTSQHPPLSQAEGDLLTKSFTAAMDDFKQRFPAEPKALIATNFGVRDSRSWQDVAHRLYQAHVEYENPKGIRGSLIKGFRGAAEHTEPVRTVSRLVPNSDLSSSLIGAIGIVADAASRITEIRLEISNTLQILPRKFSDMEALLNTFAGDTNILAAVVSLVSSIIKGVEDMIYYFVKKKASKVVSSVLNGSAFQEPLMQSLEQITTESNVLFEQAHLSNMRLNRQDATTSNRKMDVLFVRQEQMADTQNQILSLCEELKHNMAHTQRVDEKYQQACQDNNLLKAQLSYYQSRTPSPQFMVEYAQPQITQDMLISLVGVVGLECRDMEHIDRIQQLLPPQHRDRAQQLPRSHQFRRWATSPMSSELLVHGDFFGDHYVSGLSLFCSTFLQTMAKDTSMHCITFFCGRHLEHDPGDAGGRAMIKSLISQILQQEHFNLRALPQSVDMELIGGEDLDQLLELFSFLVGQLPPGSPLFCVIDGIKYYERDAYLKSMCRVLRHLLELPGRLGMGTIFKILITSPSETSIVRQAVDNVMSLASFSSSGETYNASGVGREIGNCVFTQGD